MEVMCHLPAARKSMQGVATGSVPAVGQPEVFFFFFFEIDLPY